jgi:hypothetical protein
LRPIAGLTQSLGEIQPTKARENFFRDAVIFFFTTKPRMMLTAFNARTASPTFPGGAQCVFLALRQLYVQARGIAQEGWRVKRLTATDKWNDPWFRRLSPVLKCFWLFVLDNCDLAGVWKVDMEVANFFIGGSLTEEIVLDAMPGRFMKIDETRWHVTKFIAFQQGDHLNPKNNAHLGIIRRLEELDIPSPIPISPCQVARVGLASPTSTSKGKSTLGKKKKGSGEEEETLFLDRVRQLFNKRISTPLDKSEQKAWDAARKIVEQTSDDEWNLLAWVYRQQGNDVAKYRRHDMATLLNNWQGAIDRAREWHNGSKQGKAMRRVSEIDGSLL